MIPGDSQVIACLVHDIHDERPVAERSKRAALDGVARVKKRDAAISVLRFHFRFIRGKPCVADGIVYSAVNVVGMQDDDRRGIRP